MMELSLGDFLTNYASAMLMFWLTQILCIIIYHLGFYQTLRMKTYLNEGLLRNDGQAYIEPLKTQG